MDTSAESLFLACLRRDRVALGRAMTLLESTRPEDRAQAVDLLERCDARIRETGGAVRLTISGSPGAGKSTLIEALGRMTVEAGQRIGVITVDPTSSLSRGSILGDKARMSFLSTHPDAFIRPSPAGEILGGLARRTFELMTLLEAAGHDLVVLETVGVGQSEHLAWEFTDGFILVLQPGAGDELQGIKRGITELADIVLVNKADGNLLKAANLARAQYAQALHYLSPTRPDWPVRVLACSALTGNGLPEAWETLTEFRRYILEHPDRAKRRQAQQAHWLSWSVRMTAQDLLLRHPIVRAQLEAASGPDSGATSIFKTEFALAQTMRRLLQDDTRTTR
jgi:LAO/AO transport system kinase